MKENLTLPDRFRAQATLLTNDDEVVSRSWTELHTYYAEAVRHYHNLDHLRALFRHFDAHETQLAEPEVVAWAIWYHDIIYRARRSDNETQSAQLAAQRLQALDLHTDKLARCVSYIEATAQHLTAEAAPESDLAYFLDFDLSVLAWPREAYAAYGEAIRMEYRHVPGFLYRRGRRKVLRYFLDAPRLFRTEVFNASSEAAAKANLEWELAEL